MPIGSARLSTLDQNPYLQLQKPQDAGCERVVVKKALGAKVERPELQRVLTNILRESDRAIAAQR